MPRLAALLLIAAAALSSAGPSSQDFPTDEAAVLALDAPDFALREKAARHLWRRGTAALPLLEKLAGREAESSLRAHTIAESIRLGITPETPADLVTLIRDLHSPGEDSSFNSHIIEALKQPGGDRLVLRFIQHQSKARPENWQSEVGTAAPFLFERTGDKSPIYQDLIVELQGPALKDAFYASLRGRAYGLAYDMVTYSADPKMRPQPLRRDRVVEKFRELDSSPEGLHLRPSWVSLLGESERLVGDPAAAPEMVEKLIDGTGSARHAFALTNIAYESDHIGQWISHHAKSPGNSALVAALIDQNQLPDWIEKYQNRIRQSPSHLLHLTLAQFHRAHGDHAEAYRVAKSHTAHPTHEATFAILAGDLGRVRELSPEIIAELEDEPFSDLKKRIPQFLDRLENPDSKSDTAVERTPHYLFSTRNYRAYAAAAEDDEHEIAFATKLAPVSPTLARQLLSGLSYESLERRRGKMGEFLKAKRILGEEHEVIDYISARFGTMTSEFWESFLEKYFARSPLWVMLHIRRRNPEMPRPDLLRNTLTGGIQTLVREDLEYMIEEVKQSRETTSRVPVSSYKNLAVLYRDARFEEVVNAIAAWDESLPEGDPQKGILSPNSYPFLSEPDTIDCIRNRWSRFAADFRYADVTTRSELLPSPAAVLPVGKKFLREGKFDQAVRWLTLAGWQSLVGQFWKVGEENDYQRIDGISLHLEIEQSLESALGLSALKNSDFKTARLRFENLCGIGSLDHQLGSALYHHLISSDQKTEAETLFATRWSQLESILEFAPRDAEICRSLTTWAKACDQLPTEAKAYAELAETLASELAQLEAHLTRFHW